MLAGVHSLVQSSLSPPESGLEAARGEVCLSVITAQSCLSVLSLSSLSEREHWTPLREGSIYDNVTVSLKLSYNQKLPVLILVNSPNWTLPSS